MGIVVCISMLLGLSVLQPTPWNSSKRTRLASKFSSYIAIVLLALGFWNVIYACFNISGFWFWASIIAGSAMVLASFFIFSEQGSDSQSSDSQSSNLTNPDLETTEITNSRLRKGVVAVLALSFLVYAVTLIQLNLGYSILR